MKHIIRIAISILFFIGSGNSFADTTHFAAWSAQSRTGKLGERQFGSISTPTVKGTKDVILKYGCANFIPMLTSNKDIDFPHGGPTRCNSSGCASIQFAQVQIDDGQPQQTMIMVDPLHPHKALISMPFDRDQLGRGKKLYIEMFTGNPMEGDNNADLYAFSLSGFKNASAWCSANQHMTETLGSKKLLGTSSKDGWTYTGTKTLSGARECKLLYEDTNTIPWGFGATTDYRLVYFAARRFTHGVERQPDGEIGSLSKGDGLAAGSKFFKAHLSPEDKWENPMFDGFSVAGQVSYLEPKYKKLQRKKIIESLKGLKAVKIHSDGYREKVSMKGFNELLPKYLSCTAGKE